MKDKLFSLFLKFNLEIFLFIVLFSGLILFFSLISYSPLDSAWSNSIDTEIFNNYLGKFGAYISDIFYYILGYSAWWIIILIFQKFINVFRFFISKKEFKNIDLNQKIKYWSGLVLLLISSCILEFSHLYRFEELLPSYSGGILGYGLKFLVLDFINSDIVFIINFIIFIFSISLVFNFSWINVAEFTGKYFDDLIIYFINLSNERKLQNENNFKTEIREEPIIIKKEEQNLKNNETNKGIGEINKNNKNEENKEEFIEKIEKINNDYLPSLDLLDNPDKADNKVLDYNINLTSRLIEKKLNDFGVKVKVIKATIGPVITSYEFEPETGVKGSQIINLEKDLARALSLYSIRIIESVPGKTCMIIELPNTKRQLIRLKELLESDNYINEKNKLTLALGKNVEGDVVIANLNKMPHLLISGTTGSGKSMAINSLILSLIYKANSQDLRLLLIDPKIIELSLYENIEHLLCPVITDIQKAENALNWCFYEMENRYKLMSILGVRNLDSYNEKINSLGNIENPFIKGEYLINMPNIVIIIDELADLIISDGKNLEILITKLAQKARAAGIHLILATQRPTVDIITGLIKANIPTRIAFKVNSKLDSRTILDQNGAENLLGNGDMLYMENGSNNLVRIHGTFISDKEVERVTNYLRQQSKPNYVEELCD